MKISMRERGVTLVALVVTIIVLLILAAITINSVLGNNGLIKKAQDASDLYANATLDEKNSLKALSNVIARRGDLPGQSQVDDSEGKDPTGDDDIQTYYDKIDYSFTYSWRIRI